MTSPRPIVPLKNHCSIIYDHTLYVYSPDAFQALPLARNASWSRLPNGVSVTGATCVKGGLDGDSNDPALYIVGGQTNSSVSNYSGIQRYSFRKKSWDTINPVSAVTANRINHGAAYLNASSAILVYGGSQNGDAGLSTETFLMLMYPPYRVQAYSSAAPAVTKPFVLAWDDQQAVMVGGTTSNQKVFIFHPNPGWYDLGLTLPTGLPDSSLARCNMQLLDDGMKVLQTYYMNESPNRVTRNVLLNPGYQPATYGQTIGDATTSKATPPVARTRLIDRRQIDRQNYPIYNATNAPTEFRSHFDLASGDGLVAVVGGDSNSSVVVFNSNQNRWIDSSALFGSQIPLTTSSRSSSSTSPTSTATASATRSPSTTPAAVSGDGDSGQSNTLAILGGVLGGICGLVGILIILLLWLRSVRKRRRAERARAERKRSPSSDKVFRGDNSFEETGMQPLSKQAQPMGRSPVPSAVPSDAGAVAAFAHRFDEKRLESGLAAGSQPGSRLNPNHVVNHQSPSGLHKNKGKGGLVISRPMLPDLGDYHDRPSIDLGKATPATSAPPVLPPVAVGGLATKTSLDQRKTDEGWATYFQSYASESPQDNRATVGTVATAATDMSDKSQNARPISRKGGGGGFWPSSSGSMSTPKTKLPRCDSEGNPLTQFTVSTSSPNLETTTSTHTSKNLSVIQPISAKISRAESLSTEHTSDDDYEDDHISEHGRGSLYSHQHNDHTSWTPVGNTRSGPPERPLRSPSMRVGALEFPMPTSTSEQTLHSTSTGRSSIPSFPVPAAMGRPRPPSSNLARTSVTGHPAPMHFAATMTPLGDHHPNKSLAGHSHKSSNTVFHGGPAVQDYFGPGPDPAYPEPAYKLPDSTDMSWINLGTPSHHEPIPSTVSPQDELTALPMRTVPTNHDPA